MTTTLGYTDEHARTGRAEQFLRPETFENRFRRYEVVIDNPEFTPVLPKTGLPDAVVITPRYISRERCLKLKSFKEYLFCYPNLEIFEENVVNQVLEDVENARDLKRPEVRGGLRPCRSFSTVVKACWPRPANTR